MGRKVTAVSFEGIGLADGTGETNGIMWATDPADVPSGTGGYDWILTDGKAPLVDEFSSLNDSIDPLVAREEYSAQDLTFHAHDAIAERLLTRQTEAPYTLGTALGNLAGNDAVDVGVSGLDGTIIFVHNETIKLGTENATTDGLYNASTRGFYGSQIRSHAAGSNVYTETPFWANRLVRSFTYDVATGTLDERNRYRLTRAGDGPVIEQTNGEIVAHAASVLADLDDIKINRRSSTVAPTAHGLRTAEIPEGRPEWTAGTPYVYSTLTAQTVVRKDSLWDDDTDKTACFVSGDVLFSVKSGTVYASRMLNGDFIAPGSDPLSGRAESERVTEPVYEVLCIDRYFDDEYTTVSSTKDLPASKRYHPLAIAAALLFSTPDTTGDTSQYDVLASDWGANLRTMFSDDVITTIDALIEETEWMEIDQLVLGHDGNAIDVMEVVKKKLLRPWGFFFGITTDGKITIHRVSLTDINAYEQARGNRIAAIEGTLRLEDGRADVIDTIQCNVGDLPWREGDTLHVRAVDGDSERASQLVGDPDVILDFSTISRDNLDYVQNNVVQRALIQHFAIPRLAISANDWAETGNDYGLGKRCVLEDLPLRNAWLVDRSGTRIKTINDDVEFTGQIYGRASHPKQAWAFDLQMLFVGDRLVRHRAPSAVVDSYTDNGDGTSTLTLIRYGIDGVEQGNEGLASDGAYFQSGKHIQVLKPNRSLRSSEAPSITGTPNTTMDLDGTFTTVPVQNDIVEYAFYDSDDSGAGYQADGLGGTYTYVDRVWVALADNLETIGDAAETADIYGA